MKKIFILLITILTATAGHALSQPILQQISKSYGDNSAQLICSFSSTPEYSIYNNDKRVDLILKNTLADSNLTPPETDDKIVKILSLSKLGSTTISIFFRYPPQRVKVTPGQKVNTLVIDILLGDNLTAPDLAGKKQEKTVQQKRTKDSSNPASASPYTGNWKKFIKEYEAEIEINPAVQFSLVPFPAITLLPPELEKNIDILSPAIREDGRRSLWNNLIPVIIEQINAEQDLDIRKKLTLTYGDILLRAGNYNEAYKQFFLLSTQYAKEPVGILARYLLLRLQAEYADPWLADIELKNFEPSMDKSSPAFPWLILSRIETALATKKLDHMLTLLQRNDVSFPAGIDKLKAMRHADYWLADKEFGKALTEYRPLEKAGVLSENSSSLNGYCSALYHQKEFKQAAECYDRLAKDDSINVRQHLDIISFRKVMSQFHLAPEANLLNRFAQIEMTYPNTEAGARAALKQIDIKVLSLKNWEKQAISYYHVIAETAESRSIREEAAFKEALAYHLLDQKAECVERLMAFLKDFKSGSLHNTGLALLIDVLPSLLKEHNRNGKYIETLILARQNKSLFVNNWIDTNLLAEMAEAYRQLSLFNEASKMYRYLMEVHPQENENPYYLPLIKIAYEQGDSDLVEEYSGQYSSHFPKGQDKDAVLYYRLQNLSTHNKYKEALALVSGKNLHDSKFKLLEASLLFHLNEYAKARAILEEQKISEKTQEQEPLFMLAECHYQLGDFERAGTLFLPLQQAKSFQDQAMFRLAEIAWKKGQKEQALKLFKQIVETGINPLWQKLARKELELTALNK
ncbi:MAG: hypothetical protein FD168_1939 [Desulfobulbaceae bacterium]|jgi:hypothetical protein|nr:MAG: hypothetical protein FD168_1939 [Desulfobulbaceae bacterium]